MAKKKRTRYYTHVLPRFDEIAGWCRDGLIDSQIASNLGVANATLSQYKVAHPELYELMRRNKTVADVQVENALFRRALGYEYDEVTKERSMDADGNSSLVVTKVVKKTMPPEVGAICFWLKNRRPDKWRDKNHTEITGKDGGPVEFDYSKISNEELEKLIEIAKRTTGSE